jgi:CubicO group peptidase (beta-lactamase class C family)
MTVGGWPLGGIDDGGLILAAEGGTIAGVSTALREVLIHHVDAGTIPGGVALLGAVDVEVVAAGVASIGGAPLGEDAIMRIQSMTKAITSVAALRLVEAERLELDQSLVGWLPELADRQVLCSPAAELDATVPASRPITLRHLLTNTCGYGMVLQASPLQQAMAANGTEAGPEPPAMGAEEWLRRLAELPLAFQPGEGWRYHHSYGVLGILISRVTGRPLGQHLAEDLFGPLGMTDTALWVAEGKLDRLPAAYRHGDEGLVETEPAGGGFYAGPPPFDVSHGELVSTARDFHIFARILAEGGRVDGKPMISPDHLQQMISDQVPAACKTVDSFFPGFWDGMGWGFGVGVKTAGPQRGRIGWSGGQGTDFFVDPDGTVGILLTQVELGETMWPLLEQFQALHEPS